MKKYIAALIILFLTVCGAEAKEIQVLLKSGASGCTIAGTKYVIKVANGSVTPSITGSFPLTYNNGVLKAGTVTYEMPVLVTSENPIYIDGVQYHGAILFESANGGLNIVNRVDIEDYIKGVLKAEMSPSWPIEALKAQAVLARNYAASHKHGKYEVCDSNHCQEYKGIAGESPAINNAVNATTGEILKYGGAAAQVNYYGDSGGYGSSAKSVWGKDVPYLIARPDPVKTNTPNSPWTVTVSMRKIEQSLSAAGVNVGSIKTITPTRRDESGRVLEMQVTGSDGSKTITGAKFRSALGSGTIKSTLFEFGTATPYSALSGYSVVTDEAKTTAATAATKSATAAELAIANAQAEAQAAVHAKPAKIIETAQSTSNTQPASAKQTLTAEQSGTVAAAAAFSDMPSSDIEKIYWLHRKGAFTTEELLKMVGKDSQYPQYIAEGLERLKAKGITAGSGTTAAAASTAASTQKSTTSAKTQTAPAPVVRVNDPPAQQLSTTSASGANVQITGRGVGHGVGMPQWTAKALAESGWTYRQILEYYFPGTTLEKDN